MKYIIFIIFICFSLQATFTSTSPSSTSDTEKIVRATVVNNGSTCAVSTSSGLWISSISRGGTGQCDYTLYTGIFSAAASCVANCQKSGAANYCRFAGGPTATAFTIICYNDLGSTQDNDVNIVCMGPK